MDTRTEGASAEARPSKAAIGKGKRDGNGSSVVNPAGPGPTAKQAIRTPSAPVVHGKQVEGMWLHFIGGPVHLIAPGDGTFEFERLYFHKGSYQAKAGYEGRIGSQNILAADLNDDRLEIEFTDYVLTVPTSRISGNWLK